MLKMVFVGETPDVSDYDVVKIDDEKIRPGDIVYFEREDDYTIVMKILHHNEMMTFTGKVYHVDREEYSDVTTLTQITMINPFSHMDSRTIWRQ